MHEESGPSWGMRGLRKWLGTAPETRDELLKLVQDSRRFLEPDTVAMLEGVSRPSSNQSSRSHDTAYMR
jgi:magnesium and cobalt transporter